MKRLEPEVPGRPVLMLLAAGLSFRRQGVRKWLSGHRYHECCSKELPLLNTL